MKQEKSKNIRMSINEGSDFFAHEMSINYNPTQFVFDFRNITPRIDPRNNDMPTLVLRHNVVLIEPYHAKKIYELLGNVLKKYEKDFGKIKKPSAVEKFEKKNSRQTKQKKQGKKDIVKNTANITDIPSYLG